MWLVIWNSSSLRLGDKPTIDHLSDQPHILGEGWGSEFCVAYPLATTHMTNWKTTKCFMGFIMNCHSSRAIYLRHPQRLSTAIFVMTLGRPLRGTPSSRGIQRALPATAPGHQRHPHQQRHAVGPLPFRARASGHPLHLGRSPNVWRLYHGQWWITMEKLC